MSRREIIAETFARCVKRLDEVLAPWGFVFVHEGCWWSHFGLYASGHFIRGLTRIGLSCRDTIDKLYYEHAFVTEHPSWREIERFTIGHDILMKALGHADDSRLVVCDNKTSDHLVVRDGKDRVAALTYDWSVFAAPILCKPTDEFFATMRRGARSYEVA